MISNSYVIWFLVESIYAIYGVYNMLLAVRLIKNESKNSTNNKL